MAITAFKNDSYLSFGKICCFLDKKQALQYASEYLLAHDETMHNTWLNKKITMSSYY